MAHFLSAHLQLLLEGLGLGPRRDMATENDHLSRQARDKHALSSMTGIPSTLAAAMRAAVVPIAADDALAQHGEVASGWEIYSAAGEPVIWKSGGTVRKKENGSRFSFRKLSFVLRVCPEPVLVK
jgi:hypothetical protein